MNKEILVKRSWLSLTRRFVSAKRPIEFIGKLVEHRAQSSVRKFLMLTVWPSIARIPKKGQQFSNTCEEFVASLTRRFVSSKRIRSEVTIKNLECSTKTQTSHFNVKSVTELNI